MNMKKTYITGIFILFFGLLSIRIYVFSQWSSYHNFEDKCIDCHLTVPEKGQSSLLFTRDISILCIKCHEGQTELSHPVDMRPSMKIPAGFPLDWKGDVTCNTCHTTHEAGSGKYHLRSSLRGEALCLSCHSGFDEGIGLHRGRVDSAHIGKGIESRYIPGSLDKYLDDISIQCLTCHDGISAGDSPVGKPEAKYSHGDELRLSHPIGVLYEETPAYRRIKELPAGIRLFAGRVGCASCHNPYSKRHFELVMSNERSALCLACHLK